MKKAIFVLVMMLVMSISVLAGGLVYTGQPGDDLWTLSEVNRLIAVDKNFGYTAKTWQELMLINPSLRSKEIKVIKGKPYVIFDIGTKIEGLGFLAGSKNPAAQIEHFRKFGTIIPKVRMESAGAKAKALPDYSLSNFSVGILIAMAIAALIGFMAGIKQLFFGKTFNVFADKEYAAAEKVYKAGFKKFETKTASNTKKVKKNATMNVAVDFAFKVIGESHIIDVTINENSETFENRNSIHIAANGDVTLSNKQSFKRNGVSLVVKNGKMKIYYFGKLKRTFESGTNGSVAMNGNTIILLQGGEEIEILDYPGFRPLDSFVTIEREQ